MFLILDWSQIYRFCLMLYTRVSPSVPEMKGIYNAIGNGWGKRWRGGLF